ncbi:hypothetical protein D1953_17165 [Peribacillus asahii]|uniref:Uncharacterized protein n=1 Tax=Peribacillus asahii TaxID=228899 RepID=A0A398B4H4_9BACI|nr:hypothetical protein D1953_17165 [Peribacillus asahii]
MFFCFENALWAAFYPIFLVTAGHTALTAYATGAFVIAAFKILKNPLLLFERYVCRLCDFSAGFLLFLVYLNEGSMKTIKKKHISQS